MSRGPRSPQAPHCGALARLGNSHRTLGNRCPGGAGQGMGTGWYILAGGTGCGLPGIGRSGRDPQMQATLGHGPGECHLLCSLGLGTEEAWWEVAQAPVSACPMLLIGLHQTRLSLCLGREKPPPQTAPRPSSTAQPHHLPQPPGVLLTSSSKVWPFIATCTAPLLYTPQGDVQVQALAHTAPSSFNVLCLL